MTKTAMEDGGKAQRNRVNKLHREAKDLMKKRKDANVRSEKDEIVLAELTKTIKGKKEVCHPYMKSK